MPSSNLRTAVIIVNWNGWRDTIECLSSVLGSDMAVRADIWIVDNDSSDDSVEHIENWCRSPVRQDQWHTFSTVKHLHAAAPVAFRTLIFTGHKASTAPPEVLIHIVRAGGNLGFAGGNNVGVVSAGLDSYSHFWLLNNDTVIAQDALRCLLETATTRSGLGIVGSTLRYYREPGRIQAFGGAKLDLETLRSEHLGEGCLVDEVPVDGGAKHLDVESSMSYVVGASMLVSSDFIRSVGPMCEDYFLYFEELDWAFRSAQDFKMGYAPESHVFHKAGASTMQVQSEFSLNLLLRNRIRFVARFLPELLPRLRWALYWELVRHVLKMRWVQAKLTVRALRNFEHLTISLGPR